MRSGNPAGICFKAWVDISDVQAETDSEMTMKSEVM